MCNKKGRALLQGFLSLFITDTAKTPKGAEAIYTRAIEEQEKKYAKASDSYQKITGSLHNARKKQEDLKAEVSKCDYKCKELMKVDNREDARLQLRTRKICSRLWAK